MRGKLAEMIRWVAGVLAACIVAHGLQRPLRQRLIRPGTRQASRRPSHAAFCCVACALAARLKTATRLELRRTTPMCSQSWVSPDQRTGLRGLALAPARAEPPGMTGPTPVWRSCGQASQVPLWR